MASKSSQAQRMHEDRYWCLSASNAPFVLVIARYQGPDRWTHLLRWDYERDELQPGAWTKMHIKAHRSRLSRDGRFLCYLAEGPVGGPFNAQYGGAWAISRVPWLAALTDSDQWPGGGGESRDALSRREQDKLWKHVPPPDDDALGWIDMLGLDWSMKRKSRFEAEYAIGSSGWTVHARHEHPGEYTFSPFEGLLGYRVTNVQTDTTLDDVDASYVADNIRWVQPLRRSRLATIDRMGRLELRRFPKDGGPPEVIVRHELAGRTPAPEKSPDWARAPLASGELRNA